MQLLAYHDGHCDRRGDCMYLFIYNLLTHMCISIHIHAHIHTYTLMRIHIRSDTQIYACTISCAIVIGRDDDVYTCTYINVISSHTWGGYDE